MLYPREDKENKTLLYACRNCDYKQVGVWVTTFYEEVRTPFMLALFDLHSVSEW